MKIKRWMKFFVYHSQLLRQHFSGSKPRPITSNHSPQVGGGRQPSDYDEVINVEPIQSIRKGIYFFEKYSTFFVLEIFSKISEFFQTCILKISIFLEW